MKKFKFFAIGSFLTFLFITTISSCSRVEPNFYGVLMQNYGKNGKSDYTLQQGRVNTMAPGTELFQLPAWEQRGEFKNEQGQDRVLQLKASDNTEFTAKPLYSYRVIQNRAIDVVFNNARLGSGNEFMNALENNVLEPRIYDLIKEESRKYSTDTLMAQGGSLLFEQRIQLIIRKAFDEVGLELLSFSSNLDFSAKVKSKIDSRNEVNTNISVLNQQILEQLKRNELARLQTEEKKIISEGLTEQILKQQFYEAWKQAKVPLYGNPPMLMKQVQ